MPALLILVVSLSAVGGGVEAQTENQAGSWSRLGALPTAAYGLAIDPTNPSRLYMLGAEGISRSNDAGATWEVCGRGALFMRLVPPLAGQDGPPALYSAGAGGLRQSTDGCATWKDIPSEGLKPSGSNVRWVATHPGNNDVLYAGMDGLGGLYRSMKLGANWEPASKGLPPGAWVTALTSDPLRPERIFVGVRYTTRNHPPTYIFRSTDGGLSWRSKSLGTRLLPNNGGEIMTLTWSGDKLLAATTSDGLFASTDRGESWASATAPRRAEESPRLARPGETAPAPLPLAIRSLVASPEGVLLLNTEQGAYQSVDGARTWQRFGPSGETSLTNLAFDGTSGRAIAAGSQAMWGYTLPSKLAKLPTPTPAVAAQAEPTPPPPPPLPTNTPAPPTATAPATPTPRPPTATAVARPPGWLPTDRAQPLDPEIADYAPETGHNIKLGFRDYWRSIDGIYLLGYPLTEEFEENGISVQYFERGRLEFRDGKIVWGLVGRELTAGQFFRTVPFFPSEENRAYFGPTGHSVSGPFLQVWRDNGGLETLGYPISESFKEDGSEFQWFERARLEWHPTLPEGKRIVLGQLGKELLQRRGWLPK